MKEYTKGNILLNDLGGGFYLYRYDEYVENFTKQDLLDLHSLLSEILETPTVKEEIGDKPYNRGNPKEMWCLDCPVHCQGNPPSNSEKEEVKEDTKKDIRMLMSGYPPKEPVKKPLLAIFNGKIDVNESLRRIAKYLDQTK